MPMLTLRRTPCVSAFGPVWAALWLFLFATCAPAALAVPGGAYYEIIEDMCGTNPHRGGTWQEVAGQYCTLALDCTTVGSEYTSLNRIREEFQSDTGVRFSCLGTWRHDNQEHVYAWKSATRRYCPEGEQWLGLQQGCGVPDAADPERNLGDLCPIETGGTDPINITTGNVYHRTRLFAGAGANRLSLDFHYNSAAPDAKWQHSYQAAIVGGFDGSRVLEHPVDEQYPRYVLRVRQADGQVLSFENRIDYLQPADTVGNLTSWRAAANVRHRLEPLFDNGQVAGFRLRAPDDSVLQFDRAGRLTARIDPDGQQRTVHYDGQGRPARVADAFGRTIEFAYGGDSVSITDPVGAVYQVAHDGRGDLRSIALPAPDGVTVRRFEYQDPRFPRHLTRVIDGNGNAESSWSYDAQGRAVSSERAGGLDRHTLSYHEDGSVTVVDSLGQPRLYRYESVFGVNRITGIDGGACNDCGADVTQREFDGNGFVAGKTDGNGVQTRYRHDVDGRQISRTEAAGTPQERTVLTSWHPVFNRPTLITEPGLTLAYGYNEAGQRVSEARTDVATSEVRSSTFVYDARGLLQQIDGPRTDVADITRYSHDAQGNRISMTDALGRVTRYTRYDGAGRLLQMIDPNGVETVFSYHPRGWLSSTTVGGATTRFEHDRVGNLTRVVAPDGSFVAYHHDPANRLVAISDAAGNRLAYTLDSAGQRVSEEVRESSGRLRRTLARTYDMLGRLRERVDADGRVTGYRYDGNGNLLGVSDALGRETERAYDPLDRLVNQLDAAGGMTRYGHDEQDRLRSVTDPNGGITQFEYNAFGDKLRQVSPDSGVTSYGYDASGNPVSKTDARGVTVAYRYDALDRLTSVEYPDSRLDVVFEYDQGSHGIGRLTAMHDAAGSTRYQYGPRGNLLSQTRDSDSLVTVIHYQYDAADRLTGITYPSGRKVRYDYDTAGQVSRVTLDDGSGPQVLAENIRHLPFGPLASLQYGNGLALERIFDLNYRLLGQQLPGVLDSEYGFDAVGNIIAWQDLLQVERGQAFAYDELDRLVAAAGPAGDFDYSYDPVGNRLTRLAGLALQSYDYQPDSNRLLSVSGTLHEPVVSDAAGNITVSARGSFDYSDAGRLARFEGAGTVAEYLYNGHGQRVRKVVDGVTSRFRYGSDGQLLAELDGAGQVMREYVYLGAQPLAVLGETTATTGGILLQGVAVDHQWRSVALGEHPVRPVIIAGPPTHNGGQPAVVALRNLGTSQVEVAIREWDYLDGSHLTEQVSLLALPPGRHPQPDGSVWEVGRFTLQGTRTWQAVEFQASFAGTPRLFLTQQTSNDGNTATVRARRVSASGFEAALYEQESLQDGHAPEEIGYLAIHSPADSGTALIAGLAVAYGTTQLALDERWVSVGQQQIQYEEEQSKDRETGHLLETVDVLELEGHLFVQDVTSKGGDTAAVRRKGPTPTAALQQPQMAGDTVYYMHTDHLGAVVKVTDADARVVWDVDRQPFGDLLFGLAAIDMPLRFPGQYEDAESGLFYNYFRYYDPSTGRYIQSDPIGLDGGLNTYAYVEGNPLRYIDPLGLIKVCFFPAGVTHVGFGSDYEADTYGYYPSYRSPFSPGEVRPDPRNEPKECKTVPTDKRQDECMTSCRLRRQTMPGWYHMGGRNCTYFVRDCMRECNIPTGTSPLFDFWPQPFPRDFFDNLPGKPVTHP